MTLRPIAFLALILICSCSGYKTESGKVVSREIGADEKTFRVLEIKNYAVDFEHVFYLGNLIDSADSKTFTPLSDFIGRDKAHGYYGRVLIKNSDGLTFEVIEGNFTRDKNEVYYIDKPLNSSSPKSFEILKIGHGNWTRDGQSYFYNGIKMPIKDYNSFEILDDDCFFAKDKFQVYKQDQVLEGVDAETFKFLERCIGQDKYGCHNGYRRCDCPKTK